MPGVDREVGSSAPLYTEGAGSWPGPVTPRGPGPTIRAEDKGEPSQALPLALALASNGARAGEPQSKEQDSGKTATRQSTTVKEGNTATRDAQRVGPNGGTTDAHSVRTREGDTVTTETTRTHTGPASGQPKKRH